MIRIVSYLGLSIFSAMVILPTFVQAEDLYYGVRMEQFEYRAGENSEELFVWDGDGFVGSDELKLRWDGNGEYDLDSDNLETFTNQLSLQTPIADFWDVKGGVRLDSPDGEDRWYGAIGLVGLAPQWFEVDAGFYVSEKGDASVSFDVEYELLLTNYLILTPSFEIDAAFSSDEEIGVGSGVNSTELGLRLSYDLWDRTLSPYIGVAYERKYGQTADYAEDEGEETSTWYAVIGTKLMF